MPIEELTKLVENSIKKLSFKQEPAALYQPIEYTLQNGGKRVRPLLTLLACNMFSENIEAAIYPALGFEVFHNFTLLHDDLMDNAPVRRNKPTVHIKWDNNTAILSGDAMMIEAYKLIDKTPDYCFRDITRLFNKTAIEICEGQMFDMQYEKQDNVTENQYIEMIRLKTAVLIAACLKAGAIIGNANNTDAGLLYNFGINLGLAFQLIDDWLDSFGNQENFGKKIGGDIISNKKTFLLIKALETNNTQIKTELLNWINKTNFNNDDKIKAVKDIFNTLNISDITLQKANYYSDKAFDCLNKVGLPGNKKEQLLSLGKTLLTRNN